MEHLMDFSKLASQGLSALAEFAPTLASMIGGPFAGTAVSALENVLGLTSTGDANVALAAVTKATPDQMLSLKAEDNRHAEVMEKLGQNVDELAAKDRDSARQRESAVKDWVPGALAVLLTFGFFGLLSYLMGHEPPAGSHDILLTMLGALGSAWVAMTSYYFGSSAGSAAKDATIRLVAGGK